MAVSNRPVSPHNRTMSSATAIIFLLGIANFAIFGAVFARGHPLLARLPTASQTLGRRAAMLSEFAVLFFALLLSVKGWPGFVWAYAVYSAVNAGAAWLILNGRL
jgi:hypothetical protein